jgi:hypothetical protein
MIMDFCSFLPLPVDLWHKPHIYGYVGFFIGAAIGLFWPTNTRFDAKMKATFGNTVYSQATGAAFGGLGIMVGQLVAFLVSVSCEG